MDFIVSEMRKLQVQLTCYRERSFKFFQVRCTAYVSSISHFTDFQMFLTDFIIIFHWYMEFSGTFLRTIKKFILQFKLFVFENDSNK